MGKRIFQDYSSKGGLTVGTLKRLLENYPDDMKITVRTLDEHFPAQIVEENKYKLYPIGCNGISQGENECLRIQ